MRLIRRRQLKLWHPPEIEWQAPNVITEADDVSSAGNRNPFLFDRLEAQRLPNDCIQGGERCLQPKIRAVVRPLQDCRRFLSSVDCVSKIYIAQTPVPVYRKSMHGANRMGIIVLGWRCPYERGRTPPTLQLISPTFPSPILGPSGSKLKQCITASRACAPRKLVS